MNVLPVWFVNVGYGWFKEGVSVQGPGCSFLIVRGSQETGDVLLRRTVRDHDHGPLAETLTKLQDFDGGRTPELWFSITNDRGVWICTQFTDLPIWMFANPHFSASDPPKEFVVTTRDPIGPP